MVNVECFSLTPTCASHILCRVIETRTSVSSFVNTDNCSSVFLPLYARKKGGGADVTGQLMLEESIYQYLTQAPVAASLDARVL